MDDEADDGLTLLNCCCHDVIVDMGDADRLIGDIRLSLIDPLLLSPWFWLLLFFSCDDDDDDWRWPVVCSLLDVRFKGGLMGGDVPLANDDAAGTGDEDEDGSAGERVGRDGDDGDGYDDGNDDCRSWSIWLTDLIVTCALDTGAGIGSAKKSGEEGEMVGEAFNDVADDDDCLAE